MDKSEIEIRPEAQLPDASDLDIRKTEQESDEKREEALVQLWTKRFKQSENFRRPYIEKNLRMYKLYRAYREAVNYAYGTSLMPPTGFEIIETIKPRLASAKIKVNIYPTKQEDLDNPSIDKWDDLVAYNLEAMEFDDKKIDWINAMLLYGNGILQIMWDGDKAYIEVVDNFLFYPDPKAGKRLKNSRWEIKQSFKSKAVLEKEEKKRGDDALYMVGEKKFIDTDGWKKIDDEQPKADDPRRERYQINTLKMAQIDSGRGGNTQTTNEGQSRTPDKDVGERYVEIWECFDHVEGKLQVIMNRKSVARDEDNPYAAINGGQVFIDLPDITLAWEYYGMGHLEPVETTIHEIADSRNQAMDDIVFSLDPIRKVKKGKGYKTSDLKHSPGAVWYLNSADDVVIEKPPEVSRAWVEKDNILRREIQTSLALNEYTSGLPKGNQEPASKVELLLMQTNIRFSLTVRQMEIAMTELVNSIIQMNQEWLEEDMAFRILGKDFKFADFAQSDKQVEVDATVDIEPVKEKSPEQESKEVLELYKMFVTDDKPEGADPDSEEVLQWKRKKATLQRLIVRKLGYEEYEDILAPEIKEVKEKSKKGPEVSPDGKRPQEANIRIPSGPPGGLTGANPVPEEIRANMPGPEQILPMEGAEEALVPQNTTPQTAPRQGFLQALLERVRQGKLVS